MFFTVKRIIINQAYKSNVSFEINSKNNLVTYTISTVLYNQVYRAKLQKTIDENTHYVEPSMKVAVKILKGSHGYKWGLSIY
jgi:hypothetical protein